jgi:hypothetical protein
VPAGTNSLTIVASGMHNDRIYKQRSGTIALTINVPEASDTNTVAAVSTK